MIKETIRDRIRTERAAGATLAVIADGLNADGVATAHGGEKWWPSTISAALGAGVAID